MNSKTSKRKSLPGGHRNETGGVAGRQQLRVDRINNGQQTGVPLPVTVPSVIAVEVAPCPVGESDAGAAKAFPAPNVLFPNA